MYGLHTTSLIVALCWVAWGGYWLAQLKRVKPIVEHQTGRDLWVYPILMVVAFVLLLSNSSHLHPLNVIVVPYSVVAATIGAAICVAGTALAIWSRRVLAANWSADVALKKGHELVTDGPYALVRHPIYSGMTLMFVGTAVVQGTLAPVVAVGLALVSFSIKLSQEERLMTRHFGDNYTAYWHRTKRLIPFWL